MCICVSRKAVQIKSCDISEGNIAENLTHIYMNTHPSHAECRYIIYNSTSCLGHQDFF